MLDRRTFGEFLVGGSVLVSAALRAQPSSSAHAPRPDLSKDPAAAISVAFLIDKGAQVIDFGGPWEVLQDVKAAAGVAGFRLFTVAPRREPVRVSGGLLIVPDHDFESAPQPRVTVLAAQTQIDDPAKLEWIRRMSSTADVVLSVCTGAYLLANTGLLDGLSATTHHLYYDAFEKAYPTIHVIRSRRFVDNDKFVTAGGLTSSIDGALHVVSRFYGPETARRTAVYMEHDGDGWRSGFRA